MLAPRSVSQGNQWKALPYEVASAFVRTLMLHCQRFMDTSKQLEDMQVADPEAKKKKTQDKMDEQRNLCKAKRWIVLNPKTGQLATQSWIQKYIVADSNGKPTLKDSKSRAKLWVMVFHFSFQDELVELALQTDAGKPKQKVRCISLAGGQSQAALAFFMDGYYHMAGADRLGGDEDAGEDDDESEETMIGDEDGLEGVLAASWIYLLSVAFSTLMNND